MPLRLLHLIGVVVGHLLVWLPNEMRRVAAINLRLCFPDRDEKTRRELLRLNLIEMACSFVEAGPLWLRSAEQNLAMVKEVRGLEAFHAARAERRGMIFVSPHQGNWELVGLYAASLGAITSLYRPPKLAALADIVKRGRESNGAHLVPTNAAGVRALYAALSRNESIGILPDQDPGRGNGSFAPFFDIPANTMVLLSRIAIKTQAPVFMIWSERLPHGEGFVIHLRRAAPAVSAEPLSDSLHALNLEVQKVIETTPTQYLWSYKRFKTRPENDPHRFY